MSPKQFLLTVAVATVVAIPIVSYAAPLGTSFTIQGRLDQDSVGVTGTADMLL